MAISAFNPPNADGTARSAKSAKPGKSGKQPAPEKSGPQPAAGPALRWDDRLSLGVAEIDEQHRQLIGHCNDMIEAVHKGRGQEAVAKVFTRLREYTATHFAAEERYMERIGYPGLAGHRAAHADMVQRVKEYQRRLYQHEELAPAEVRSFLKDWLVTHLLGEDMKIAAFVKAKESAPQKAAPASGPEADAAGPAGDAPAD